jgi:hypothetical protein
MGQFDQAVIFVNGDPNQGYWLLSISTVVIPMLLLSPEANFSETSHSIRLGIRLLELVPKDINRRMGVSGDYCNDL